MTTIEQAGGLVGSAAGLLERERIIAKAGFNRWLVPPAALCIHLCIGMAYGFSVFWLPLSHAIGITSPWPAADMTLLGELFTTTCDWRIVDLGWMYTLFFVVLGSSAAIWGGWLERSGPRKAGVVAALCWCGGLCHLGGRRHQPSAVDAVARLRRDRRHRARARLHLAGLDPGQMVSGPSRHGDRHGHHGVRRRRHDRRAARRPADEPVPHAEFGRRLADLRRHGGDLFRVHDGRRFRLPRAAGRLAPGRLGAARQRRRDDHAEARSSAGRAQDAAVLADLGRALSQCQRRHRGDRHGLADAAGDFRRIADRPSGARVSSSRRKPARHHRGDRGRFIGLLSLFNIGGRFFWASLSDHIGRKKTYYTFFLLGIALYAAAPWFAHMGNKALFVVLLLRHPVDVWRRLRHRAGLPGRCVRHPVRRRHSRPPAHRLVDRRNHRPGGGELHPRGTDRGRCAARLWSTTSPCTSWPECWFWVSSATS